MIIRNTDSSPYTTNLVLTFTEYFEMPYFVRVGNSQTFTTICITILLDEFTHEFDSLTSSSTTLENYALQFFNHEHTIRITQFTLTSNGSFTDTQLLFVHTRIRSIHECISLTCLRYFAFDSHLGHVRNPFSVHASIIDSHGSVTVILLCRNHVHPCTIPTVACMAGDNRTICRCFFTHHNAGTTFRVFFVI